MSRFTAGLPSRPSRYWNALTADASLSCGCCGVACCCGWDLSAAAALAPLLGDAAAGAAGAGLPRTWGSSTRTHTAKATASLPLCREASARAVDAQ